MRSCLIHSTEEVIFRPNERPLAHYPEHLLFLQQRWTVTPRVSPMSLYLRKLVFSLLSM